MSVRSAFTSILILLCACGASHAATRAFVASYGNDANGCTPTAPCRSFAKAFAVVDAGGEIVALDAAGYGTLTIDKSVTITANQGFHAGIATSGTANAITITADNIFVNLRNLNINGPGPTTYPSTGVMIAGAASVAIDNCIITSFNSGVTAQAAASVSIVGSSFRNDANGVTALGGATVDVTRSTFVGNTNAGVFISAIIDNTTTRGTVTDSSVSGSGFGFIAFGANPIATAILSVARSSVANNSIGVAADTSSGTVKLTLSGNLIATNGFGVRNLGSVVESYGNNSVRDNGTDSTGTITPIAGL